ncbi:hypothetical protein fh0823_02920 [Francisella halioticida]|uniref:hypothetical protein n=1 Tax=Francisella halioticida TaxID=549298 RepID=UPI0012F9DD7A|nr:hypothetical protein [Francisella halioticida]BCD90153.1 hypothetical protein fh0823_02920 [Francisella halioticida]
MKKKIPLTIALTASMSFGVAVAEQAKVSNAQQGVTNSTTSSQTTASCGGKCASGSCGSHSKSKAGIKAQDSSCGGKCASGSCGSHSKSESNNSKTNQTQAAKQSVNTDQTDAEA